MEKPKPKSKRKMKQAKEEKVPLADITDGQSDTVSEGSKSTSLQPSKKNKKPKTKKNVVSPSITSIGTKNDEQKQIASESGQGWKDGEEIKLANLPSPPSTEVNAELIPESHKDVEVVQPRLDGDTEQNHSIEVVQPVLDGVDNPALDLQDESADLPGSVPNLQDPNLGQMIPVVQPTIIDDTNIQDSEIPTLGEENKSITETPGKNKKFLKKGKVVPIIQSENIPMRPTSAPGSRVPFQIDFSPQLHKRPSTAAGRFNNKIATTNIEETIGEQENIAESPVNKSQVSLRSSSAKHGVGELQKAVAYVPYIHARSALTRIIEDMKNMKLSHISIVGQIEEQYLEIEDHTKKHFNAFVLSLQTEHDNKVTAFRQAIELHKKDLDARSKNWSETIQSMNTRNKKLLNEKRALLLAYRRDTSKLETECEELRNQLFNAKDKNRMLEKDHEESSTERKIIADETASEKAVSITPVTAAALIHSTAKDVIDRYMQTEELFLEATTIGDLSDEWKEKYTEEMSKHEEDLAKMTALEEELKEANARVKSRGSSSDKERMIYENKIKEITKELAQTRLEYKTSHEFLITLMSVLQTDEQYKQAKEKIANDKSIMKEEVETLQSDIDVWKNEWSSRNDGKEPSEEDRTDSVKELYTQLDENTLVLDQLTKQEEILDKIKTGRLPQPVEKPLDPIVTTVTLPDPDTEAALAASRAHVNDLEEKLSEAQRESKIKKELEVEIIELKSNLEAMKIENERLRAMPRGTAVPVTDHTQKATYSDTQSNRDAVILLKAVLEEAQTIHSQSRKAIKRTHERLEQLKETKEKLQDDEEKERESDKEDDDVTDARPQHEVELSISAVELLVSGELTDDLSSLIPAQPKVGYVEYERPSAVEPRIRLESMDGDELEEFNNKLDEYQSQVDGLESDLRRMKEEKEQADSELEKMRSDINEHETEKEEMLKEWEAKMNASIDSLNSLIEERNKELEVANKRIEELEEAAHAKLDVDAKEEIKKAKQDATDKKKQLDKVQSDKHEINANLAQNVQKVQSLNSKVSTQSQKEVELRKQLEQLRKDKQKELKDLQSDFATKEKTRKAEEMAKIKVYENKIKQLELSGGKARQEATKSDATSDRKIQRLESQVAEYKKNKTTDVARIKELEKQMKEASAASKNIEGQKELKKVEKKVKDLEKKLETEGKKFSREQTKCSSLEAELEELRKNFANSQKETKSLNEEVSRLTELAEEGAVMAERVVTLEGQVKELTHENHTLTENYNSERVLRKKYYNMVEDMKGKIRVYCRARPLSKTEKENGNHSIVKSPDEFTIQVESTRSAMKEFNFDQIFTPESSQSDVFEDTHNLVQSAVDGFNVCIFAYGQTGSGKTYTMIGDSGQTQPGIAPRAFNRIFDLIEENKSKFSFKVSCYMLELYNEKLIDLLSETKGEDARLDIKKDKKGMVFVQGSVTKDAHSADELNAIFEKGSKNRHVASTKMNDESSRSHLVIAVIMESTNLTNGNVVMGKLSLVDLAGSERVGKTGATAQQLKEANSINKSLSALGDVISALSSEQSFIPYRNNKLTMLMQDSLGGNAKTLMFVNVSPANYNSDETVISLTYASRVKLITNDASKNADSKEVARLKNIISKMKSGETVEDEE